MQVVAQPLCIRLILMQLEERTWELWQLVVTLALSPTRRTVCARCPHCDFAVCEQILLVPLMSVCSLLASISQHHLFFGSQRIGMRARTAVTALLFKKCLMLRTADTQNGKAQLVTLISSDAERLVQALTFFHFLWAAPIEILLALGIVCVA
jgi:lipopolysaccharide/colanic/teichoic acid biosynthesis glycosyltransferase